MEQNRSQLIKLLDHQWQNIEPQYTANTNGHDAAVVLASPGFAKLLADKAFLEDLAVLLSRSENGGGSAVTQFHLVAAVADRIHQIALSNRVDEGISILRSHRDILLPKLWDSVAPKERQDVDLVSALTFALPESETLAQSSVTMPLARTLFQNGRPSTLIASSFDLSGPSPKLVQTAESHTHTVNLPSRSFDYWAPLLPLTPAREVTQSFGNIVRGIQVDGESLPASTELEDAIINKLADVDLGLQQGEPVSVFAVVTPPVSESVSSKKAPEPALDFEKGTSIRDDAVVDQIHDTAEYVQQVLESGGKLFKVCKYYSLGFLNHVSIETNKIYSERRRWMGSQEGPPLPRPPNVALLTARERGARLSSQCRRRRRIRSNWLPHPVLRRLSRAAARRSLGRDLRPRRLGRLQQLCGRGPGAREVCLRRVWSHF